MYMERVKISLQRLRSAIEDTQKPIVYLDGATDVKYLKRASELLNQETLLGKLELRDGGGCGNLKKIWKTPPMLAEVMTRIIVLLHDCDDEVPPQDKGNLIRQTIPMQRDHPIKKGIENLFGKGALEKALHDKPSFIDIDHEHTRTDQGKRITVPERWEINDNEKTNLCNWLCKNGTKDDFQHFKVIFQLLQDILHLAPRFPLITRQRSGKGNANSHLKYPH